MYESAPAVRSYSDHNRNGYHDNALDVVPSLQPAASSKSHCDLFFPLLITAVGANVAIPPSSRVTHCLRGWLLGGLLVTATYFLLCLRLTYFQEWKWGADVKQVYSVLDCMSRNYGVKDVSVTRHLSAPLNFYRAESKNSLLSEIVAHDSNWALPRGSHITNPRDAQAYVFNMSHERDAELAEHLGLKIIYRSRSLPDDLRNTVIAVKPEPVQALLTGPCLGK